MKIKNIFRITLDSLLNRAFMNIMLVIVCGVSIYMSDVMLTNYIQKIYNIEYATSSFATDINHTFYINFQKLSGGQKDTFSNMVNRMKEIPDISFSGTFSNNNLAFNEFGMERLFPAIIVDKDILEIGATGLAGDQIQELQDSEDTGLLPVIVGYNYKELFKIGEPYTSNNQDKPDCVIAGYFNKGASWILRNGPFHGSGVENILLDDSIMVIRKSHTVMDNSGGYPNTIWYVTEENADTDKINAEINHIAKENNFYITIDNVEELIAEKKIELNLGDNKEFIATIMIVFMAVISISASAIIVCIVRKRTYGILYANGISMREIGIMTVIENTILILIPSVCVYFYRVFAVNKDFSRMSKVISAGYFAVHNMYVPAILTGIVILMIAVSVTLPLLMIRKMKPVELIGGQDD